MYAVKHARRAAVGLGAAANDREVSSA
jgi:hypothetical protein